MFPFLLLLFFVPWVFLVIGLGGVLRAALVLVTAAVYSSYLSCRFAVPTTVVASHHLPVVGYFLLGLFSVLSLNITGGLIYWMMATHGLRQFLREFRQRVVRRGWVAWCRSRPCARATGWLGGVTAALCAWFQRWWDSFGT